MLDEGGSTVLLLLVGAGEPGHSLNHGQVPRINEPLEPGEEEEDRAMKSRKVRVSNQLSGSYLYSC